jgi:D-alanine-D-alanine ligase-like ATP-grasp enzyme
MTLNIGIIMGGYSKEIDISFKSGNVVYDILKINLTATEFIFLKKNGFTLTIQIKNLMLIKKHLKLIKDMKLNLTVFLMLFTGLLVKMVSCKTILANLGYQLQVVVQKNQN